MNYIVKRDRCDHCGKKVYNVEVQHGFAYNSFKCPHCNRDNKRGGLHRMFNAFWNGRG